LRLAKCEVFCFCSRMVSSNDNRPPNETARLLPILGKVDPRGKVIAELPQGPAGQDAGASGFPNDPREA
jgi:hypothetical protein